jgi:hypothetical protein
MKRRIAGLALVAALAPDIAFAQDAAKHGDVAVMDEMTANVARKLAAQQGHSFAQGQFQAEASLAFQSPIHQAGGHSGIRRGRKVAYGILFGIAGFYAGGAVGAALEPNCHCDDPGLAGALIGMPIGAIAGAVFGVWLGGR